MKIKVKVEAETPEIFEEIEIEFPIYALSGYNHKTEKGYVRGVQEVEHNYEVKKIVSPTEEFSLQKRTTEKTNGERWTHFEMEHHVESEAHTRRHHFLLGDSDYDQPGTAEHWDTLFAEFQAHLQNFK